MEQQPSAPAPAAAPAAAAPAQGAPAAATPAPTATPATPAADQGKDKPYEEVAYRTFPVVGSRVAIWMVAQLHLLFAAFVLAVPIFAFIVEAIGYKTGDMRYDRLAYEFTKLLSVSFSLTATFGAFLTFMLIALYPKFTNYLMSVFSPTFLPYVLLFFFEAFFLYTYYYGWGKFHPLTHLALGLGLNIVGTAIMFIANAWLTFMMSPQRHLEPGGGALRLGCGVELHVDADQRAPRDSERRVRRIGRRRLRGLQVPAGRNRRRARPLRLDGLHRQLRRDQRVPAAAVRRLLARQGDLRVLADARPHDDGRRLLVAVHHPGGADRQSVPRRQLLPVARHGTRRGPPAAAEVHQVPAHRHRALLHRVGDAAFDHRDGVGDPRDGRIVTPRARLPRGDVREEHRGEHPDPHDVHELPALPADRERPPPSRGRRPVMPRSSRSSRAWRSS